MKKISLYLTILVSFALINCSMNDDSSNITVPVTDQQFSENFGSLVSRDFLGLIVDTDNQPMAGAEVRIGNSFVITDVNGVFSLNGAQVFERFAYIRATKQGYIDGTRALIPTSGKNIVKIMMLPMNVIATVNSGAPSEVSLPNGATVIFDGDFITESGTAYTGAVSVVLHHLDPADPEMAAKMPGMLYAQTSSGNESMLLTYGMINVKMLGSNGEKLQIANSAEIEMPVSADQPNAPAMIPLWHFDETTGYWKEDGSAMRMGNKYVGTVSHFSWWNVDVPMSMVQLTITIQDSDGIPVTGTMVKLSMGEGVLQAYGYTDENGQNSGGVPINQTFTLTVHLPCGPVSFAIGPFAGDTNFPPIIIENPTQTSLQGEFVNCDGEAVTNGYVIIGGSTYILHPVTDGTFNIPYFLCPETANITVRGFDIGSLSGTDVSTIEVTEGINQLGTFTSNCGGSSGTSLEGAYHLVVTNLTTGAVRIFPDIEYVNSTGSGYQTTTTGTFLPGQLNADTQGYYLYQSDATTLNIPAQQLAGLYSNVVEGSGNIIDENTFTTLYEISFAAGNQNYQANYIRM